MVYQEVLVGYFKWAQMRGFRHGHIWSCPPQRGDNFIFWCHPPHQRTPSRDRLNAWYNSILLRSSKLGVLEEVGTLWSAYFSGYGRRESSCRKDRDKDKEDARAGALSTAPSTVNNEVFMDDQISMTSKCAIETGPIVLSAPSGSSSSSGPVQSSSYGPKGDKSIQVIEDLGPYSRWKSWIVEEILSIVID